ncbi:hypothetical protein pdam_00019614 [Pocillopora damicornis]|uniref:Uncharacterized protein n=1 Tax=Pocillopora damicornis TaxID=46731 RepID=A0A3M6TKE0_POCDA|nr:hypothetical protein pdam_00019614 [Pocillopora damicornis]
MVREGTGKEITRDNRKNPHIRNTTEINTGGTGAIPPGPKKGRRRRMEIPPNVNCTAGIKKILERGKTRGTGQMGPNPNGQVTDRRPR